MKQIILSLLFLMLITGTATAQSAPFKLGSMQVFPLLDAQGKSPASLLVGATEEQVAQYVPEGELRSQILAFLVKISDQNFLFDTGLGTARGGKVMDALKALDVSPSDIDAVFLTHLHMDHVGGLTDANGKAIFSKAEVYVSRVEREWWCEEQKDKNIIKAFAPYEGRLRVFEFGESPLPGITAIDASGHTPGHTVFHVRAGEGELLVIGDILHFAEIQLPLPQIAVKYDTCQEKAPKARKYILDMAADKKIPVAGMHCPFPGLWCIAKKSGGGYEASRATQENQVRPF
ncbi:MAG: MBL fold metallo-hydrolase [Fretibacterium sp.]|nr:MBL fold metallo-hydrolase [Fretibacterium sp.]